MSSDKPVSGDVICLIGLKVKTILTVHVEVFINIVRDTRARDGTRSTPLVPFLKRFDRNKKKIQTAGPRTFASALPFARMAAASATPTWLISCAFAWCQSIYLFAVERETGRF